MLLSTQTSLMTARLGYEEGVLALKRAGYDALDFSLFSMTRNDSPYVTEGWREYVEAQRRFADANGIVFNQSHAPFSFRWDDATVREEIAQPRVLRSLEIAAMMGVKAIVVHPLHYCEYLGHEKEMHELNLEYYRSMIPYCREYGIQVAVENMWQNERRRRIISYDVAAHPEELAAFIDLGHCGLVGEDAAGSIRVLGHDRLGALHVHDNNYREDTHTLPGIGLMDWNGICAALHDINYKGEFTFEADTFLRNFPNDYLECAAAFMVQTGRYLISKIG